MDATALKKLQKPTRLFDVHKPRVHETSFTKQASRNTGSRNTGSRNKAPGSGKSPLRSGGVPRRALCWRAGAERRLEDPIAPTCTAGRRGHSSKTEAPPEPRRRTPANRG